MEKISFDYVTPKKGMVYDISSSQKIFYAGLLGLILVAGITWLYGEFYEINLLDYWTVKLIHFGFLICVFIGIVKGRRDFDGNNLAISGIIFLDENEITIDYSEIYPLEKIVYIKFSGYDVKGNTNVFAYAGDPNKSLGAKNYLEFQYEQTTYNYQFIVRSLAQKQLLRERVIPLLEKKTKVIIR